MIGSLPMAHLAPLDYRYALDAAMSDLAVRHRPLVLCHVAQLADEVRQRIPVWATATPDAGLWVEPRSSTWQDELALFARALPRDAPLVIVASRPLARLLPERRGWGGEGLGLQVGGIGRLWRALPGSRFAPRAIFGLHSGVSIGLSLAAGLLRRLGRPELGDRLHFAARLNYCLAEPLGALATVALLFARKGHG